jgi:hypothetical protein
MKPMFYRTIRIATSDNKTIENCIRVVFAGNNNVVAILIILSEVGFIIAVQVATENGLIGVWITLMTACFRSREAP